MPRWQRDATQAPSYDRARLVTKQRDNPPVRYVAAGHLDVCADSDTVAMLKAILRPDLPGGRLFSADQGEAHLSLQPLKESVSFRDTFTVALVADRPATRIDARVVMTKAVEGSPPVDTEVKVHYEGGPIRSIPLEFAAPDERAVLLFRFKRENGDVYGKPRSVLVVG